jgi:hypothetical protein
MQSFPPPQHSGAQVSSSACQPDRDVGKQYVSTTVGQSRFGQAENVGSKSSCHINDEARAVEE